MDLVGSNKPWDIKKRDSWNVEKLGNYLFEGVERSNDYFGNYMYGVTGKEMFIDMNFSLFGGNLGTDSYLINAAGLAQQWSNNGKVSGSFSWIWIRVSSGFSKTGDNQEDVNMIKDGIERWYRDYK